MSFALTTDQVRAKTKTVTRRMGWATLRPGDLLQPVEKAQGLKKGERVVKIGGPIRITSAVTEPLQRLLDDISYGWDEVHREGFTGADGWTPWKFVDFFCRTHACTPDDAPMRIAFEYVG